MAGHHRGTETPTREAGRIAEHHRRVMTAPTGRRMTAAAFDRWRSAARRCTDPDSEWHAVAMWLNERAKELEAA